MAWPDHIEKNEWVHLFAGMFFRVEGGAAVDFKEDPPISNLPVSDQNDMVRRHEHSYNTPSGPIVVTTVQQGLQIFSTSASANTNPNQGDETRPVNTTIRVWKKTAD